MTLRGQASQPYLARLGTRNAASARRVVENDHNRINGLPATAADGADNADDSGKAGTNQRDATLASRICAQCRAGPSTDPPSDAPTIKVKNGALHGWVHAECHRFWLKKINKPDQEVAGPIGSSGDAELS
jgi:hypothetical protein